MSPEQQAAAEQQAADAAAAATSGQPTTDGAGGDPSIMSPQDKINQIIELRGGTPELPVGEGESAPSARESAMAEKMFQIETEQMIGKFQMAAKTIIPDATDDQLHEVAVGMLQMDPIATINSVKTALKTEQEKDEKSEKQEDLEVEGGASGKEKEDGKTPTGLAGAMRGIYSAVNSAA